jgi:hypothetical protein
MRSAFRQFNSTLSYALTGLLDQASVTRSGLYVKDYLAELRAGLEISMCRGGFS